MNGGPRAHHLGRGFVRAMPEGFPEAMKLHGIKKLMVIFSAGPRTVRRWRDELNGVAPVPITIELPDDFADNCLKMTSSMLMRHYGIREGRLATWLKESGARPRTRQELPRPVPDDFADVAPTQTRTSLVKHYQADSRTINRWVEETGVSTKAPDYSAMARARPAPQSWSPHYKVQRDFRRYDQFDEAADILRRERFAVYRCGPTGKYLEKGLHWRVGNVVCSPDELMQRAERYRSRAA